MDPNAPAPWPTFPRFTLPPAPLVEPELTVAFILAPNFTLLPFAGFIDALRHAADMADYSRQIYCRWTVLSPDDKPIRSSCGLKVMPWAELDAPARYDYIVVVGGLLPSCLKLPAESYDFLRQAAEAGVPLIGLCTGSFVMAAAGLLEGRRCGVHIRHREEMAALFPEVVPVTDETYVVDGPYVTCPGGTAGIDVATEVIARHCGKARALKGLRSMMVEQHRAAYHIPQRSYEHVASCGDWKVERAIALMEQHISTPFEIGRLARLIGTTVSQLDRGFAQHAGVPPSTFWRRLRLEHAHWLLTNSTRKITEIALEVGFYDATHFTRHFKQAYGETPRSLRTRSRRADALDGDVGKQLTAWANGRQGAGGS